MFRCDLSLWLLFCKNVIGYGFHLNNFLLNAVQILKLLKIWSEIIFNKMHLLLPVTTVDESLWKSPVKAPRESASPDLAEHQSLRPEKDLLMKTH